MLKKKKIFDIVYFIQSDTDNENKSIDCVPSSWIYFDKEMHQLMTKFMPPPYTAKKCSALHKLVKENKNAPDKWPNYPVNIVKSAGILFVIIKDCKSSVLLVTVLSNLFTFMIL